MPQKIKFLHNKTKEFKNKKPKFISSIPNFENIYECNNDIIQLGRFIKVEVIEFRSLLCSLQMWISLHTPKIEEGDHKRVDIINDTLTLLTMEILGCSGYLSQYLNYYIARGKLILLSIEYPFIYDFYKTKDILDTKLYFI